MVLAVVGLQPDIVRAQLPDYTGRAVVDLIEALRDDGRRIAYSRELLPTRLRVTVASSSQDPLEALREVLAPHGLGIELGPRDTWLVVSDRNVEPAFSEPAPDSDAAIVPPALETVIVTASRYPIERRSAVASSSFGRQTLETVPALGQDPLRVAHRLPGVASTQLTSKMHVRGGDLDEVLVRLDGVRLYNPYHLKDFQNVFSSLNPRIIESLEVRTGGYEANYGDRMSGVIDLGSIEPVEHRRHELGISLLDTSILSSGLFAAGRGAWVTSLRRGNLDVLAEAGDSGIGTPQYVDFFNKVDYAVSARFGLEAEFLSLDDKINLNDGDQSTAAADYDDRYVWVTLTQSAESGLEASYRVSLTRLDRTRTGTIDDVDRVTGSLAEQSRFEHTALTADWSYQLFDSVWVDWGAEYATMDTRNRFASSRSSLVTISAPQLSGPNSPPEAASLRLNQSKRAIYASFRHQPVPRLVTELGVRWDDQSSTGEDQVSPRLSLRFELAERTRLRAGWGRFAQSDSLSELAVADGATRLRHADESRHSIIGLEHEFGESALLRVEVFRKNASRLTPRYENLLERVSLLPELLPDRFVIEPSNAVMRGIEVGIQSDIDAFSWWANIAVSRASETLTSGTFSRSWEERRAMKAGGEWAGDRWTVSAALAYRSGWPISSLSLIGDDLIVSDFNGNRLPDFSSVDMRVSRSIDTSRGSLEWFIEAGNLADHSNYCCLDYELIPGDGAGMDRLSAEYDELLGFVPNVGFRWRL